MTDQATNTADKDELEDSAAPLIEHLAELRTRLIRAALAFLVGVIIAFAAAEPILQFLLDPIERTLRALGDPDPTLQFTAPQEYLFTLFRISFVFGFALAFPVIAHQLWRFIAPGLYRKEKNAFLPFIFASPFMFMLGAAFAHFVVTPLAMAFFLGFADVASVLTSFLGNFAEGMPEGGEAASDGVTITFFGKVNESLDISLKFIMAFGLCFQLPVLLTLMGKAGLVTSPGLKSVRKYAMVGILVLAALVTPPDVITQMILFTAVYGLYEISIWLVMAVEKKREAQLREEGVLGEDEGLFDAFEDFDDNDDDESGAK